jgi:dipeptidyl aminopeptidase/acylaminoacyl peptidase
MNKRFAIIICAASVGFKILASGPDDREPTNPKSITSSANPQAQPVPIDDLYYTRSLLYPSWSPDGTQIVFTCNLAGRANLWKMPVAGGWPVQMVQSDDRQFGGLWSRDGKWIVYQQDRGGGEYYDIYAIPAGGGAPTNLTSTPDISETTQQFSPDGKLLAIGQKLKTGSSRNIGVLDWETKKVRKLTDEHEADRNWSSQDWSPDGKFIYAARNNVVGTDSDIYRIDVAGGKMENLTPHQGEKRFNVSAVSPDGRQVLLTSNAKNGAQNVALLDVATKELNWVTDTTWEATSWDFSPDGKYFVYVLNTDGRREIYLVDCTSMLPRKLNFPAGSPSPVGHPSCFSPDGRFLLIDYQSSRHPDDFWLCDLGSRQARQITFASVATLNPDTIPEAQIVHYRAFDGKIISAFLWVPFNLQRDTSNPAIVMPHGGPTGQTTDTFDRNAAALASRGYVVIAPNPRGSTGYGIEFQKANIKDLGGGDLQDEIYAADFLVQTGYVNPKKIGITGGSYGGFMTLMAIGKTPDRWAAAVESYGIIDWFSMLEHSDPGLQQYERSLLGDPKKDRQVYEEASPLKYLRNAKAPLLVLQGENDIRVPKEEADQVVDILRREGRTVDVHYYPAEGHGFLKRENQIDAMKRTIAWFDKYLKGDEADDIPHPAEQARTPGRTNP